MFYPLVLCLVWIWGDVLGVLGFGQVMPRSSNSHWGAFLSSFGIGVGALLP